MLSEMLNHKINIIKKADSWENAIRIAAEPLLKKQYINEDYIEAMIKNVLINGPYIVILPEIAIPHSQSKDGVLKTGMSLLKVTDGVMFPENKVVKLLVVLAAKDIDLHMELVSELADIFMEDDIINQILLAKTEEEILGCLV